MLYKAMHRLDKYFLESKGIRGNWDVTLKLPKDCELFMEEHGEEYVSSFVEDVAVTFIYEQFTYYLFLNVFEKDFSFAGFHARGVGIEEWGWFEEMFVSGIRQLNGD